MAAPGSTASLEAHYRAHSIRLPPLRVDCFGHCLALLLLNCLWGRARCSISDESGRVSRGEAASLLSGEAGARGDEPRMEAELSAEAHTLPALDLGDLAEATGG